MTPCSPLIGRSWMWDHRAVLAALPVGDLVLTGSHDAGAYRDYQVQYSTVQYRVQWLRTNSFLVLLASFVWLMLGLHRFLSWILLDICLL